MPRLEGVSAVVTGAGSGLGRAIVDRFVAEGARVVAFDRAADKLTTISTDHGDAVEIVVGDVTSYADNDTACRRAVERFGSLDVFIANAGVWDFGVALEDLEPDAVSSGFDELFSVNVKGYLLGARAASSHLRGSRGSLTFTLSNAALYPGGGGALYTASKHAGVGLVRQLAYEFAPHVRVNAVAPGGMPTDLRGPGALGQADSSLERDVPIDEIMRASTALQVEARARDYVAPYVLLASREEARTVTGTVIDVSGFGIPPRLAP